MSQPDAAEAALLAAVLSQPADAILRRKLQVALVDTVWHMRRLTVDVALQPALITC